MDRYSIALNKKPPLRKSVKEPSSKKASSVKEKDELINQFLQTSEGRQRLAASMVNPMRRRLDMGSIARRVFLVQSLLEETIPIYDTTGRAHYVSEDGESVSVSESPRIVVPIFPVQSAPQISLTMLRHSASDAFERAQDIAYQEIRAGEEERALMVLDSAVSYDPVDSDPAIIRRTATVSELDIEVMAEGFVMIERSDLRMANVLMNAREYSDIRRYGRDQLNINTHSSELRQGLMGSLWGAQITVSRAIPPGQIYFLAEPQFVGQLPIRQDIEVLSADDPEMRQIGFNFSEQIGLVCTNPFGVARITVSGSRPVEPNAAERILRGVSLGRDHMVPQPAILRPPPGRIPKGRNRYAIALGKKFA
jgi:Phage capsid family.